MKSAFLIMAHNNFDMLKLLICSLDYKDNDIFVHIDKKCGNINYSEYESLTKISKTICLRVRENVVWGNVSQIAAEFRLFEAAFYNSGGGYDYYHLISGVDFPLKSNQEISDFLELYKGKEFLGLVKSEELIKPRLACYHLFTGRDLLGKINRHLFIPMQKLFHIHYKNDISNYRMGPNWCSISCNLVEALLMDKKDILKRYHFSFCCDEVFLQTFVYEHENFLKNVFDMSNQYRSCMRYIDWKRGNPYTFTMKDLDELSKADGLFVRKVTKEVMVCLIKARKINAKN